jgi:hypothetical protein
MLDVEWERRFAMVPSLSSAFIFLFIHHPKSKIQNLPSPAIQISGVIGFPLEE